MFVIILVYHRKLLVWWSLHKYKCLWGVGCRDKSQGLSFQEEASHTNTLRLG